MLAPLPAPEPARPIFRRANRSRIGDLLMQQTNLTKADLASALSLQKHAAKPIGELLIARQKITDEMLTKALATQWDLPQLQMSGTFPDVAEGDLDLCLSLRICPVLSLYGQRLLAISDPDLLAKNLEKLPPSLADLSRVLCTSPELDQLLHKGGRARLRKRAEERTDQQLSCRTWAKPFSKATLFAAVILALEVIYLFPLAALWAFFCWTVVNSIATSFLRFLALSLRLRELVGLAPKPPAALDLGRLHPNPVVSVLVPLHREAEILPLLVQRLEDTDYPKELLEFCLVVEQNDFKTRSAIRKLNPGPLFRTLVVPDADLKTKPRAMNYALDFCKGSVVGIYDAEDAPERDQISRIVRHFANAGPEVACIQAYLDFYNPKQNWLARCFSIEYAIWFRVVLHGIDKLKLPIPLGGTSVFFRREALENLGAWDAHNVTEDADLGMRLARFGYRCEFESSTTFEEANCHARPWVKQRSRWLKGYLMTWITHMRNPAALWKDLGPKGFFTFQVLLFGTLSTFLTAPLIWSFWLISFGATPSFVALLPWQAWTLLGTAFVVSEVLLFCLGIAATWSKSHRFLMPYVPTMMFYWPLGSIAAVKALYETLFAPFYWDKTVHGHSAKHAK